jgi:GntR family transcriptional regulator, transcriptional repressor for pyruvate dehydrogenase complex
MFVDPLDSLHRERLGDIVARKLELAIRGGQYPPGSRLPAQRQLANDLGVSRPVLRESLQLLELRGLVNIHYGSGTYVAEPVDFSTSPESWLRDNISRVNQFYEFRRIIEPAGAALAAQRATKEEVLNLKRNIDEAALAVERNDITAFVTFDVEFHALVAQMSHNPYLLHTLNQSIHLETDVRHIIHLLHDHLAVAHRRHVAIYEAIAAGDAERSRELMDNAFVRVVQEIVEASSLEKAYMK